MGMRSLLPIVHYSGTARMEGSVSINGHLCDFIAIVWQTDLKELDAECVKIEGEKHRVMAFSESTLMHWPENVKDPSYFSSSLRSPKSNILFSLLVGNVAY